MEDTKKCPFCAEIIKAEAIKCKHCGSMLGSAPQDTGSGQTEKKTQNISAESSPAGNTQGSGHVSKKIPSFHELPALHVGFWARVAAYFIDVILFTVSLLLLAGVIAGIAAVAANGDDNGNTMGVNFLFLLMFWTVCAIFEATRLHATPGKFFLGLEVVNSVGERPSLAQAFGRNYGKFLSLVILYIGFMLAGWTSYKQALHDMMADTFVVHKRVLADYKSGKFANGNASASSAGVVIGVIVGIVALLMFVGILAAIAIPAYQDYIARSQMSEGIQLSGGAEVGLAEYMQNYQRWPDSLSEVYTTANSSPAGRYTYSVSMSGCYGQTCGVIAVMKNTGVNKNIAGTSVEIWTNDGGNNWQCGPGSANPVQAKYLPASCRDQGAP